MRSRDYEVQCMGMYVSRDRVETETCCVRLVDDNRYVNF